MAVPSQSRAGCPPCAYGPTEPGGNSFGMGIPSYEIHRFNGGFHGHGGTPLSLDGLEGKIVTGNHGFSHEMWGVPVIFPLNQSIDLYFPPGGPCFGIGLHVVMAFWVPVLVPFYAGRE